MNKKVNFLKDQFSWSINKNLLSLILADRVSDIFVCELVWERLFYIRTSSKNIWVSSEQTPLYWSEKFSKAPQIISERPASIHLTRSIPKDHKQGLKELLNFKGYTIKELNPTRTRRATATNLLIYWSIQSKMIIKESDTLPKLSSPYSDPKKGHYGDPDIK